MSKHGTANYSLGQYNEVLGAVQKALPGALVDTDPKAVIAALSKKGEHLQAGLNGLIVGITTETRPPMDTASQLARWIEIYRDHFCRELNVTAISIPERKEGFDRLLVVAAGLTANIIFEVCSKLFPCHNLVGDLDVAINVRDTSEAYAVWVRDNEEVDLEDFDDYDEDKIETLIERLAHELVCYIETEKHLDVQNYTVCGAQDPEEGSVPVVTWEGGTVYVDWYDISRYFLDGLARSVIC